MPANKNRQFIDFEKPLKELIEEIIDLEQKKSNAIFALPNLGNGSVVQLVRMPPCHGGGRGFESRPVRKLKTKIA